MKQPYLRTIFLVTREIWLTLQELAHGEDYPEGVPQIYSTSFFSVLFSFFVSSFLVGGFHSPQIQKQTHVAPKKTVGFKFRIVF